MSFFSLLYQNGTYWLRMAWFSANNNGEAAACKDRAGFREEKAQMRGEPELPPQMVCFDYCISATAFSIAA